MCSDHEGEAEAEEVNGQEGETQWFFTPPREKGKERERPQIQDERSVEQPHEVIVIEDEDEDEVQVEQDGEPCSELEPELEYERTAEPVRPSARGTPHPNVPKQKGKEKDVFAKRLPKSPMPAGSLRQRRPVPKSRSKSRSMRPESYSPMSARKRLAHASPNRIEREDEGEESDDPLAGPYEPNDCDHRIHDAYDERKSRDRTRKSLSPPIKAAPPPKRPVSSKIPLPKSKSAIELVKKASKTVSRDGSNASSARSASMAMAQRKRVGSNPTVPAHTGAIPTLDLKHLSTTARRRKTLDDEIQRAGRDNLWRDAPDLNLDFDLSSFDDPDADADTESGILVGTGTRSKRRGFLAGGGAGGVPVFMGVGYVPGAVDED